MAFVRVSQHERAETAETVEALTTRAFVTSTKWFQRASVAVPEDWASYPWLYWEQEPVNRYEQVELIQSFVSEKKWEAYPVEPRRDFYQMSLLALIWQGAVLETGASAPSGKTQTEMCGFLFTRTPPAGMSDTFEMEADNEPGGWLRLAVQAARAWQYAREQKTLTVEVLCKCHGIMFDGAVVDKEAFAGAGKLRTEAVFAGAHNHQFPDHRQIPTRLQKILKEFNHRKYPDAIENATNLFYQIVTLHPFINGNGRISRLLFAYSQCRDGFPFPVFLTNGRSKARKNFIEALKWAQERSKMTRLRIFAVTAVERAVRNAQDFFSDDPAPFV